MIAHRTNEVMTVPDTTPTCVTQMATEILRCTSGFGVIAFYLTRLHGPLAVKVPVYLMIIALVGRTLGLGALYPIVSIFRTGWIMIRTVVVFLTDNVGSFDLWFWAFVTSLLRPIYQGVKFLIDGQSPGETSSNAGSSRSVARSQSA